MAYFGSAAGQHSGQGEKMREGPLVPFVGCLRENGMKAGLCHCWGALGRAQECQYPTASRIDLQSVPHLACLKPISKSVGLYHVCDLDEPLTPRSLRFCVSNVWVRGLQTESLAMYSGLQNAHRHSQTPEICFPLTEAQMSSKF